MAWFVLFLLVAILGAVLLSRRRPKGHWIVVDGSNVLYWEGNTPSLASVGHVVGILKSEGYDPVVWFDANVGYLIGDRYMGPGPLADRLGLPRRQVFVAEKGSPADPLLLEGAEKLEARVVTNDRYRDWEEAFPRIREEGFLVRGFINAEEVGLEWERGPRS
jgi:hypothetical protein